MNSALSGIKVLDITDIGPASFASQILGDMGAEVIKISQPPKSATRGVGQGVAFIEGMDPTLSLDTIRNKKNMGRALDREDLIPRWFSPDKDEVFDELKQIFRTKTRDEWFEKL